MSLATVPKTRLYGPLVVGLLISEFVGFASDLPGQEVRPKSCAEVGEAAAWWSFDVEGHPESAAGNPGAVALLTGAPGVVEGRVGRVLELVEPSDGISLESSGTSLDGDVTVETWLRTDREEGVAEVIRWSSEEGGSFLVGLDAGRPFLDPGDSASTVRVGDAFLSDGRWHHLGVVVSRGDSLVVQILVDGDPVTSTSVNQTVVPQGGSLAIGGADDQAFVGALDELTVYARALKRTEIVAIWAAGDSGKCSDP